MSRTSNSIDQRKDDVADTAAVEVFGSSDNADDDAPPSPSPPAPSSPTDTSITGSGSTRSTGTIEVHLRIRPSSNPSTYHAIDDLDPTTLVFTVPADHRASASSSSSSSSGGGGGSSSASTGSTNDATGITTKAKGGYVNNTRTRYPFSFTSILPPEATQADVFRTVGVPALRNAIAGYNSTIFAYGQTGSGKTYSITGGPERYCDRGIIPRAISWLFEQFARAREEGNATYCCYVSYLELYNECGYDLLARDWSGSGSGIEHGGGGSGGGRSSSLLTSMTGSNSSGGSAVADLPRVTMLEDEDGNYHFRNLTVHPAQNEEEALNLLFRGDTNRAIGETEMNQSSSRSHCIFTVMVEGRRAGSDTVVRSKLNLVDLAGSERVHKTSSSGQTLSEAKYINTSLFFLEMVIVALHERARRAAASVAAAGAGRRSSAQQQQQRVHVPYRNSLMTSVLRDSLGGNCKTVMIATISPEAAQVAESISTCQFAQRVALVKNTAEINEEVETAVVIERLRGEVGRLREEVKYLKGENGEGDELTEEQVVDLERRLTEYVEDRDAKSELDLGTVTLNKIQTAHGLFKKLVLAERMHRGAAAVVGGDDGGDAMQEHLLPGVARDTDQEKHIVELEKLLKRRDHEITLLVDMVKQKGLAPRALQDISHLFDTKQQQRDDNNEGAVSIDNISNHHPAEIESPTGQAASSVPTTRQRMLCGVVRCDDPAILELPSKSFDWFRERYPATEAIDENKNILKAKYKEAKETGEIVQKSRDVINHHKNAIKSMRREREVEEAVSGGPFDQDKVIEPHHDEQEHKEIIDREKKKYKDGFSRLRTLKGEIEHVQLLLEKTRASMQYDFDKWYLWTCEREDAIVSGQQNAKINETRTETRTKLSPTIPSPDLVLGTTNTKDVGSNMHDRNNIRSTDKAISDTTNSKEERTNDFKLPPGVKLTGNKDIDDDIIAFYRAKSEMLERSQR